MPRFTRLARRAWNLRHDREALLAGLDRAGIRVVPGAGRYENRSPRVGALGNDAWAGHVTRSLAELERLAAGSSREARDATLALADWDITHHEPARAIERLTAMPRLPRDGRTLRAEAERLVGPPPAEPFAELNRRLARAGFSTLQSADGTFTGLHAVTPEPVDGPLATVIVPAFNAASTIANTLTSLVAQSWRNLEIIVVDDASTDHTTRVVVESIHDERVTLLRQPTNLGAYAARNRALAAASGDYVTVNDADDWAHPAKIATQVQHLGANTHTVATASSLVRITHDLRVVRRGLPHGRFVGRNYASLMMHTERLRSLGGWDDVRVGADSELEARLTHLYGPRAITRLHEDAPLTLALSDASSLTGSSSTGLASSRISTGARRLYTLASTHWHQSLSLDQPQLQRTSDNEPFPVPNLIRRPTSSTEHLDVIIWSDLALPGGTTASNLAEVAANEQAGWRTGLVHNRNPKYRDTGINPKFFDTCSDHTRLLSAGEEVSCDVLVIKYPPSSSRIPDIAPNISVHHEIVMIANQTPWTGYTGQREQVYDIAAVDAEVARAWGRAPLWCPIGPAIRNVFETHHATDIAGIRWADTDWFEIIDVASWTRRERPNNGASFRIGRHGRDSVWKWPNDPAVIQAAYPSEAPYVIDILGGADEAKAVLGRLPANWHVRPFDSISPVDYLAQLDVFVHVAHPDMEEAFGRTILEALAAGVPVISEPRFAAPFGDAVIACSPADVAEHLERLRNDSTLYRDMIQQGIQLAESRYGFSAHHERIARLAG